MMKSIKPLAALLCFAALVLTGQAQAACATPKLHQDTAAKVSDFRLVPAVYHEGDTTAGSFIRVHDFDPVSIVGLWEFKWAGFATDWGTQAWHSDGTELTFSTGQNPATGDTCQGVWQQIGARTYTLNHVAMGWAAPGANPLQGAQFLRVHLHFTVTLDPSGNTFSGKYTAAVYLESESDPFDENPSTNAPIATGTGSVTATRVRPDDGP
jgi:hypothetical protein